MKVIQRNELEYIQLKSKDGSQSFSLSALISEKIGSKQLFIHSDIIKPGSSSSRQHSHSVIEEVVYIVKGTAILCCGLDETIVSSGSVILLSPNGSGAVKKLHLIKNNTNEDVETFTFSVDSKFDTVIYEDTKNIEITLPHYTFSNDLREVPTEPKEWQVFLDSLKAQLLTEVNLEKKLKLYEFIGLTCRILLKLDEAEYYLLKACELSTTHPMRSRLVQNQNRLAHVYQWKKEFQKAHLLFDQIQVALNENSFSEILVAACQQHLGKLYFDQGFYHLAMTQFNLALKIRLRQKAPRDQIESTELAIIETKKRLQSKSSEEIIVRRAEVSDAEAIHNAHMKSIKEICSKEHTPDEIRVWSGRSYNPDFRIPPIKEQFVLVAEANGVVEGFCHLKIGFKNNEKSAHLFGLYITPKILKKNIGTELTRAIFEYCKCLGVQEVTLTSSLTAFDFYKKQGFVQSDELSGVTIEGVKIRGYPMRYSLLENKNDF